MRHGHEGLEDARPPAHAPGAARALLVEDDRKISAFVTTGLRQAGFAVDHSRDGKMGLDLALTGSYDVGIFDVGDLSLDLVTRQVRRGAQGIDLQPREFAVLECLMRHAGQPLSRSVLLQHVWHYDFDPQTNVVEVLVSRLRGKLDGGFDHRMLHTLRGLGYVLRAP